MLGRPMAFQFYGWGPEGFPWQRPPRPFGPRWPGFWRMQAARRFFGPWGPRGPWGPHGPHGPDEFFARRRFFARGDLKYVLLELLQERPMHGYEMMKVLEEGAGGFYAPSPGSVYPTLQMLEDRGLITASEVEGRKVYTITDAGRAFLAEHRREAEALGPPWAGRGGPEARGWRRLPELQALRQEAREVGRLLMIAGRVAVENPEQLARLRTVIERTRRELTDMIYGASAGGAAGAAPPPPEGAGETPPTTGEA
jgi:DNA-binding PadR family transcriptional regulator